MRRPRIQPERPGGREDLQLIRGGRRGVWWQSKDGMQVMLAAPEREERAAAAVERTRLSALAVLLAIIAGGGTRRSPRHARDRA